MDGMRGRVPPSELPAKALGVALGRGLHLGLDDIREWSRWMDTKAGLFICPTMIVEFVEQLTAGLHPHVVADPWAGIGSLLIPIVEKLAPAKAIGIERNPEALQLARRLDTRSLVDWVASDPILGVEAQAGELDLIVSCLPMLPHAESRPYSSHDGEVIVADELPNQVLLSTSLRLSPDGIGVFVVTPSFLWKHSAKGVRANLSRFGLSLDAVFSVPEGAFAPMTSMSSAIVVVRRGESPDLFVGEVAQRPEPNEVLIANYRRRHDGSELPLGRRVDPDRFVSYAKLAKSERVGRLGAQTGLTARPLRDLVVAAEGPDKQGCFEVTGNAIYVPTVGVGRVVTDAGARGSESTNWIQLTLDEEQSDARYVAAYLNTDLGKSARQAQMRGSALQRLSPSSVKDVAVYLPSIDVQLRVVDAEARILGIEADLAQMKTQLWAHPLGVERVSASLSALEHEEGFVDWLESLPYPLASILWTYHATAADPRKQLDYLDHFFEALAEFMATLLLSAFRRDPSGYDEERKKLLANLEKAHLTFERPSFGAWVTLYGYFAKRGRGMHGNAARRDALDWLFCGASESVLEMLFSSRLVSILQSTNSLRNDSRGHGPPASDRAVRQRLSLLTDQLAAFRDIVMHHWDSFQLVLPGSMTFTDGAFVCSAQRLVGTRTPFASVTLQTAEPLDSQRMYFAAEGSRIALPMMPFVKVLASPDTAINACYFFNRREPDGFRFVSYHFEDKDSVTEAFPGMEEALADLIEGATPLDAE